MEKLDSLKYIWLDNNQITTIEGLENLANLQEISLKENNISEKEIKEFQVKHSKITVL